MISFIIPTYSVKRHRSIKNTFKISWGLSDTIDNIVRNVKMPFEIVVVCNSNDNKLVDYVRTNKKINKYCVNNVNVGVSRAWNIGAMLAEGDVLCFVNDDVEIGVGSIDKMVTILLSNDEIGEIGPAGGKFDALLGTPGPRVQGNENEEVDEVSGYLFIIRRKVYDLTGGFDTNYTPASFEEIDMSFKIRSLRHKCIVVPNLNIIHHNYDGISTKFNVPLVYFDKTISTKELYERNKRIFINKWSKFSLRGAS